MKQTPQGCLKSVLETNIPVTSAEADVANWRWYVEAMVLFIPRVCFTGVLKEEEKEKEKDNQYKLKKAMATPLA